MKLEYPHKGDRFIFNNYLLLPDDALLYVGIAGETHATPDYRICRSRGNPDSALFVLECVTEGKGYIRAGDTVCPVKAGDFYMVSSLHDHEYYADREEPFTKIWVNLYGSYIRGLAQAFSFPDPLVCHIDLRDDMKHIHSLVDGKSPYEVAAAEADICESVFRLLYKVYIHSRRGESSDDRFIEIRKYIRRNISNGLTVDKICEENYISRSSLYRLIKKNAGVSPNEYVADNKIRVIKLMLANTNMDIGSIAGQMHFYDYNHFFKFFKKHTGMSPAGYRKQARK